MSSAAHNATSDPKKKLNYNPLRPNYNPLRPQNNSRNTSSISIGSETQKDVSTSDMIHNAKTIYNPQPTNISNNTSNDTSNDPHKTIFVSQSNNEKPSMNQEEVDKLNEDIDQLSKNINEHLQMSHNENGSSTNLNGSSTNLHTRSANPLAPTASQTKISTSSSSKVQDSAPVPDTSSASMKPQQSSQSQNTAPAAASATSKDQQSPQSQNTAPAAASAPSKDQSSTKTSNSNDTSNNNGFDKLDPDTEICVQPTNLNPDRSKPIYCEHCHEKIVGSILSSGKKFYHPKHFLCNGCNCSLNGKPFFEVEEQILCVNCYNNQHGVKCAFCNEFITGQYITALNKNWHPDHLRCSECNEPISSIIEEKDGKAYCHKDYQKLFGICCNKCKEPILSGGYITALDKPWHVDCFVCNICNEPFTSSSFYEIDGFPYCSKHYEVASQCNFCKTKIVDNKRIRIGDLFYHPNHVFCTCCKKAISELITNDNGNYSDLFKITDNNVVCKNCVASQTL